MSLNVLAIGDTANVITDLKKYTKKIKINLIDFKERGKNLTSDENTEILEKYNLFKHLKKINSIKNQYDIFLVMGWTSAKIAYLAGLNYVMYFVGNDIRNPPFGGHEKSELFLPPKDKLNKIEKKFYRTVLEKAVACITVGPELGGILKKYRNDCYRIDHILFDKSLFKAEGSLFQNKTKFTFFNPQRISYQKGFDILWEALPYCKSNFEILQVDWFDFSLQDKRNFILSKKPSKIKIIPLIPRKEISKYYSQCDAVIGNLRMGYIEGVGREGAMFNKPVLNYTNPNYLWRIDGQEIVQPFVPQTKDPIKIAEIIDKIVVSKEYRNELVKKQYEFVKNYTDPRKTVELWENLLIELAKKSQRDQKRFLSLRMFHYLFGRGVRKIFENF